ncbi:SAM-dependent methyltransferase [Thermocatellispora tengchongensis]|uniref:SAM-dependent methyltransferase n=1 Tax=Thermocatellispora tengchongensis TaxID=1073253 RepID=A0A840PG71_9ACTN|nr:SAM-dependent methyltransferase [Thermocatellispora tengchongensis]MBB5138568.1 SAM-dependent methyltransferase [Thermocatellispora tengchongensis]
MDFDPTTPNVARLYDYYLGGKDNFAADREAAEKILAVAPELRLAARENRAFLGRAVRFMAREGITQFLDIGTGLPTQGNVHEVAGEVVTEPHVVYVDRDPVVLTHARALLAGAGRGTTIVQGDLRRPEEILTHPDVVKALDFSRPIGLLLVAVMHFITEDDGPARIMATLRDALPPGSLLALSHGTRDARAAAVDKGTEVYQKATSPLVLRTRAEIEALFTGLELVEPGVVWLPQWRPDHDPIDPPDTSLILCGVGRKQ